MLGLLLLIVLRHTLVVRVEDLHTDLRRILIDRHLTRTDHRILLRVIRVVTLDHTLAARLVHLLILTRLIHIRILDHLARLVVTPVATVGVLLIGVLVMVDIEATDHLTVVGSSTLLLKK